MMTGVNQSYSSRSNSLRSINYDSVNTKDWDYTTTYERVRYNDSVGWDYARSGKRGINGKNHPFLSFFLPFPRRYDICTVNSLSNAKQIISNAI